MELKLNMDAEQVYSSDYLYDLFYGGDISPKAMLTDQDQIKAVNDAIKLIDNFLSAIQDAELLCEM